MDETLKPCPLCGGTDLKHYVTNARERNRGVIVCKGCGLRLEAYSDDEYKVAQAYMGDFESAHKFTWEQARDAVADKWNRRAERTCRVAMRERSFSRTQTLVTKSCSSCGHVFGSEEVRPILPGLDETMVLDEVVVTNYCPGCGARVVKS